jgi:hypothetical protein
MRWKQLNTMQRHRCWRFADLRLRGYCSSDRNRETRVSPGISKTRKTLNVWHNNRSFVPDGARFCIRLSY